MSRTTQHEEVLQLSPWSSGPMIFTHLKLTLVKEDDSPEHPNRINNYGFAFSWVYDPTVKNEFDSERGHYNV